MPRDASKPSVSSLLRALLTGERNSGGARDKGRAAPSRTEPRFVSLRDDAAVPSPARKTSGVPAPGALVAGKYVVERWLGAGGMGVVVAARHIHLEQRVAIKFLRGTAGFKGTATERFLREARAAVALSSEHVARVLDLGMLESNEPFIVMEYLDGVDLRQVLDQRGPMPIVEAVGSVLQACEAIAEAHSLDIVHRDLKPANLFLAKRRDGTTIVKVLDFGISKSSDFNTVNSEKNLTASGLVMGSPGYMSPEQVRNASAVDARTDVWALGVILYELVAGVRPFAGDTAGDTFARIISERPLSVRSHRSEVPEELARLIAKCLEIRVDQRIQSVGELASGLLPFASKDMGPLVERVLRWSAAKAGSAGGASKTNEQSADSAQPASRSKRSASPGTGPTWRKSGASTSAKPPMQASTPIAVIVAIIGVALVAASVFALDGRAKHRGSGLGSSTSLAASVHLPIAVDAAGGWPSLGPPTAGPREGEGPTPADARRSGQKPTEPVATTETPQKSVTLVPSRHTPPAASTATRQREIF